MPPEGGQGGRPRNAARGRVGKGAQRGGAQSPPQQGAVAAAYTRRVLSVHLVYTHPRVPAHSRPRRKLALNRLWVRFSTHLVWKSDGGSTEPPILRLVRRRNLTQPASRLSLPQWIGLLAYRGFLWRQL